MLPAALLCAARGRVPVLPVCRQMLLQVISSAMVLLLRRRCGAVAIHVMLLCRQRYGADAIAMAGGRLLWGWCLLALGCVWEGLLLRLIAQPELLQLAQRIGALTGLMTRWPASLQQALLILKTLSTGCRLSSLRKLQRGCNSGSLRK